MISYSSLDEIEGYYNILSPQKRQDAAQQPVPEKKNTECNNLVMMFIGGVLILALLDTVRT